jgi:hypothetical protein
MPANNNNRNNSNNNNNRNNSNNNNNRNDKGPAGNTASKNNAIAAPTIKQQSSGSSAGSVRDQIKSAGSNGNISKNELLKISDSTGKSTDQIIRQLDKVNANSASNNKAPIGVGNAAFNSLLNTRTNGTMFGKSMDQLGLGTGKYANYGTGAIGQAIIQAKGSYNYDTNSFSNGTGRIPVGQQVFGSYNGAPQLQIKPQNNVNAGYYGAGVGTGGGNVITDPVNKDPVIDPITDPIADPLPLPKEEEPLAPSYQSSNNAALYGNAGGFKQNKSSWKRSGKSNNGTNNLKINATKSASGVGINTRGF